ncbi:2-polyprenyl-6-methoxyphenol hydroxylase-like FAD-dependent oxidoreductase [Kibdelosporangium banguiense]|uniref:2-polyprenyl-6-methoxyphenol hydroxylase-like FAD-dependent oxidoreductase n=1 Tax=Kibdelosporangium banguiense TaxID=1365924 RepID=A0ABS4TPW4_9PSEU|nr:FAD-dependent oxidoreductase [Kibdelosporangium banguiense]MBP2325946.1 2-polyprenyl-6-methoxyphenol hydroxylase-like FAD-dependent oxidoreductase [Kibdelosporangium banguiense]
MHTTDVLVVGAGPTGLMLAGELAMAGVSCRLLERRTEEPNITRAFAVHARTLELLDARGMADDLLPRGIPVPAVTPAPRSTVDLRELDTRYPMILIAPQSGTERTLQARAKQLDVEIVRGAEVVGIEQDADGVTVKLADGGIERARYLVGCDGAHSAVRQLVGIDFAGKQYETHILLADVQLANPPEDPMFARNNADGAVIVVPFGDGWFRAIAWDRLRERAPLKEPVTLDEMRDAFHRIAGDDYGMGELRWSTRFLSERRQAEKYRVGRVFLAGDAAHVHSPLGGQGMNTGIQDAMNLGWKLAAAVQGSGAPWLLDSYESERHPVGEQVLALTDAFNKLVLGRSTVRRAMQRVAIRLITSIGRTRRAMAARLSGVGISYPRTHGDHRLTGHRMSDVDCSGVRLYELLRQGQFVLLTKSGTLSTDRSDVVSATHSSPTIPAAVLVRPDGYVAWAADNPAPAQLAAALDHWCGQAQKSVR